MMVGTQTGVHLFSEHPIFHHQHHLSAGERSFETGCRPRERTGEGEGYLKQFMIVVTNTSPYHHNIFYQESLKRQLKLILDIDPKTPGESLAKELRQVGKNYYHDTIILSWKYHYF